MTEWQKSNWDHIKKYQREWQRKRRSKKIYKNRKIQFGFIDKSSDFCLDCADRKSCVALLWCQCPYKNDNNEKLINLINFVYITEERSH